MTSEILSPAIPQSSLDQRVVLEGVRWHQYELLLATLGDDFPALRLSYLEGTLEVMTTSPCTKSKKMIGMLMEAYFQESRTRFHAIGSATFRKVAKQRGLEPDECYCLEQNKQSDLSFIICAQMATSALRRVSCCHLVILNC